MTRLVAHSPRLRPRANIFIFAVLVLFIGFAAILLIASVTNNSRTEAAVTAQAHQIAGYANTLPVVSTQVKISAQADTAARYVANAESSPSPYVVYVGIIKDEMLYNVYVSGGSNKACLSYVGAASRWTATGGACK